MNKRLTLPVAAIFVLMFALTLLWQQYTLYVHEADPLFRFSLGWIASHLQRAGGATLLITSLVAQFFRFPLLASVLTAALYVAIWFGVRFLVVRQQEVSRSVLAIIPLLPLVLCIEDHAYSLRGHTAVALSVLGAMLCLRWLGGLKPKCSVALIAVLAALVHYLAGNAVLFAAIMGVRLFGESRTSNISAAVAVATAVALSAISYASGTFVSMAEALLPLQYYNWPSDGTEALCVWAAIVAVLVADRWLAPPMVAMVLAGVSAAAAVTAFCQQRDGHVYRLRHESYLADNGRWADIVELNERSKRKTYFLSYLNLALAHRGELLNRMFEFRQQLPSAQTAVMTETNEVLRLKSHIYYGCNYVAPARKSAFDSSHITPGGVQPHDMLHFIATNKIVNTAQATQKYVDILEQTLFYADTARALFAQPNIGNLPGQNNFFEIDGFTNDFAHVIDANPQNAVAKQFYLAYILLSADKNSLRNYISAHANEPLHPRLQEACTIMFTPDECQQLGVSNEIMQQFEALKQGKKLQHFYQTYWFYIAYLNTTMKK